MTRKVASMLPEEMAVAGQPDDFVGTVAKCRVVPWNYGQPENYDDSLFVVVNIDPSDDSEYEKIEPNYYGVAALDAFHPSNDGETSSNIEADEGDETREGKFVIPVGRRDAIPNSSNWARWVRESIEAGFPKELLVEGDVSVYEGITARFNQVNQDKRSGIEDKTKEGRVKQLLVITDVLELPAESKGGKVSQSVKPKTSTTATNSSEELDSLLETIILGSLSELDGAPLPLNKLPGILMRGCKDQIPVKEKSGAVRRGSSPEFLNGLETISFDSDSKTVSMIE